MSDKIPTSREFLDTLARGIAQREGLRDPVSDYRLAQVLGCTRSNISAIRSGRTTLGSQVMERLAEILGVSYEWILACVQAERAQNVAARMAWQRAARKLASLAIALILFVVSAVAPVTAARSSELFGGDVNIHYAHWRRWWLRWALRLARLALGTANTNNKDRHHEPSVCPPSGPFPCAA